MSKQCPNCHKCITWEGNEIEYQSNKCFFGCCPWCDHILNITWISLQISDKEYHISTFEGRKRGDIKKDYLEEIRAWADIKKNIRGQENLDKLIEEAKNDKEKDVHVAGN